MSSPEFYQQHLNSVSRSFALCISRLESPLREWVGLTYLLCRILDTIEDATWPMDSAQLNAYADFENFIEYQVSVDKISSWQNTFPKEIPNGEKELLSASQVLFADFHKLPAPVQAILRRLLNSMLGGMRYYSGRKVAGRLQLRDLGDVNLYCLFVAGVVGEALSELLLIAGNGKMTKSPTWIVDAHHFGLFLQKINLLKDQKEDEAQGRYLIPDRDVVYRSLQEHANATMRYIEAVDTAQVGYRIFCLWSFFLGLKTLPLLKANEAKQLKLGRGLTLALFEKLESLANNGPELRKIFHKLMQDAGYEKAAVPVAATKKPSLDKVIWPEAIQYYQGHLHEEDLRSLNLVVI